MDFARILRASQIRFGGARLRGAPAILAGVAGVIIAAGFTRALVVAAPALPEALRAARDLVDAARGEQRRLPG